MTNLSFARVSLRPQHAHLLDAAVHDEDPRFDDYMAVMGTTFLAEAYASSAARDAALGAVDAYIEFVPASASEVHEVEYPIDQIAIGHAFGEPGFMAVAEIVLPAVIATAREWSADVAVVAARVSYLLRAPIGDKPWDVVVSPLYGSQTSAREERTARWLLDYVAGRFAAPAT